MIGACAKFSGPFTVRVQEPGGTFDTEIRIEEYQKQYDIIYHTKYKRIRRGATNKKRKGTLEDEEEEFIEEEEDGNPDEKDLIAEPDRITFEWIRLDPDCIWLSHLTFEQEDFMWNSVLRQDKDVNAQYEAIIALSKINTVATGSILSNLMKDNNFFYRLRMEAAYALTKFDTPELDYLGINHLMKYLMEHYVMTTSPIPLPNDFTDLQDYYMRLAIIKSISIFRDDRGWCSTKSRSVLIDLLALNDNAQNKYTDSEYIALLIDCICNSFLARPKRGDLSDSLAERVAYKETRTIRNEDVEEFEFPDSDLVDEFKYTDCETVKNYFNEEDHVLLERMLEQISRYLVKDRFESSYQNKVTVSCLEVDLTD